MSRSIVVAAALAAATLGSGRARAAPAAARAAGTTAVAAGAAESRRRLVVLLRPPASDAVTIEALARIRGELSAALFEVVVVPQNPALDSRTALQTVGRDLDPIATFAILRSAVGAPDAALAEVWIYNRVDEKTVIQRMRVSRDDPERGAAVLAVQAVELLKASLAEFWAPAPPVKTPEATGTVDAKLADRQVAAESFGAPFFVTGLTVEGGIAWLQSFRAIGAVWQPELRIAMAGGGGLGGRLMLVGLGSKAEVAASGGVARIDQRVALFEVLKAFRPERRLQPFASVGLGAGMVHVDGTGNAPFVDASGDAWSLLTSAGGGVMVALHRRLALALGIEAWLAWPHAKIVIDTADAGQTGWPALMLHAGVVGVL